MITLILLSLEVCFFEAINLICIMISHNRLSLIHIFKLSYLFQLKSYSIHVVTEFKGLCHKLLKISGMVRLNSCQRSRQCAPWLLGISKAVHHYGWYYNLDKKIHTENENTLPYCDWNQSADMPLFKGSWQWSTGTVLEDTITPSTFDDLWFLLVVAQLLLYNFKMLNLIFLVLCF